MIQFPGSVFRSPPSAMQRSELFRPSPEISRQAIQDKLVHLFREGRSFLGRFLAGPKGIIVSQFNGVGSEGSDDREQRPKPRLGSRANFNQLGEVVRMGKHDALISQEAFQSLFG